MSLLGGTLYTVKQSCTLHKRPQCERGKQTRKAQTIRKPGTLIKILFENASLKAIASFPVVYERSVTVQRHRHSGNLKVLPTNSPR